MSHATPAVLLVFSTLWDESIEDQHHDPLNKSFSRWWCWGRPSRPSPKVGDAKRPCENAGSGERQNFDWESCPKLEVKPSTGQPRMGDWKWCLGTWPVAIETDHLGLEREYHLRDMICPKNLPPKKDVRREPELPMNHGLDQKGAQIS